MIRAATLVLLTGFLMGPTGFSTETAPPPWDVENPPGPKREQSIEVNEGTWISVDVSPDGEKIVFDLLGDLYLMPFSGSPTPQKLTAGMAWDMQPRFSPDGSAIAFTSDRSSSGDAEAGGNGQGGNNLWILPLDGGNAHQVTSESVHLVNGPSWSPDGQYLVGRKHFTSRRSLGAGEMWLYHRDGNTEGVQLTKRPNDQKDVNEPVFSLDGKYLYFSQDTTPGNTFEYDKDSNKQIYVIKRLDLETGEQTNLITGPGGACRPVPSRDGKRIAFVRRVGAKTGLHVFDTESGAIRLVNADLERDMQEAWAIHGVYPSFAWTPDDQAIVIWARGKIRKIRLSDGREETIPFQIKDTRTVVEALRHPVQAAPDTFTTRMLRWVKRSPDESKTVFQALGHLYMQEGSNPIKRLTDQTDHFEFCPSFSRDGTQLVYSTWNDRTLGQLRVFDFESNQSRAITSQPGHYLTPVFSPDSETIVFRRSKGGYLRSHLWSQEPGLYRMAASGEGTAVKIHSSGRHPQFGALRQMCLSNR